MKRIFILQIFAFFATIIFASPYTIKPGLQCDQYANHYTLTFNMPNFEVFRDTLSDIYGDYYFSYTEIPVCSSQDWILIIELPLW